MITWNQIPTFDVRMDGNYDLFDCTAPGEVQLDAPAGSLKIEFPLGWSTDFTTGNWFTHIFVPQMGPHAPAAALHDRLLDLNYPRAIARGWMHEQLKLLPKVGRARRWAMVAGVRVYDYFKYGV